MRLSSRAVYRTGVLIVCTRYHDLPQTLRNTFSIHASRPNRSDSTPSTELKLHRKCSPSCMDYQWWLTRCGRIGYLFESRFQHRAESQCVQIHLNCSYRFLLSAKATALDEQAYRGKKHPSYCTCASCTGERLDKHNASVSGNLITRILRLLRLKR